MPIWLFPILVVGAFVVVFGLVVLLGRIRGGRYLRPIVKLLSKVGFIRRWMMKASVAALERENPDLASAMKKMEMWGAPKNPQQAQKLMSRLSPAERRAYIAAAGEQDAIPEPANRAQRRAMEKMQQTGALPVERRQVRGGKKKR